LGLVVGLFAAAAYQAGVAQFRVLGTGFALHTPHWMSHGFGRSTVLAGLPGFSPGAFPALL
jgi:hypothetical protein